MTHPSTVVLVPRLIRLRDAPRYLGMDKNRFNRTGRDHLGALRPFRTGGQTMIGSEITRSQWIDRLTSLLLDMRHVPHYSQS